MAAFVIIVFLGNLSGGIWAKHVYRDDNETLLVELKRRAGPGDLVLLRDNRQWKVVSYYAPEITAVGVTLKEGDEVPAAVESLASAAERAKEMLLKGQAVFLSSEILEPDQGVEDLLELPDGMTVSIREAFDYADSFQRTHSRTIFAVRSEGEFR